MINLKSYLNTKFTPSQLSKIYIVSAVLGGLALIVFFTKLTESKRPPAIEQGEIQKILLNDNTRQYSLEALNDQLRASFQHTEALKKEIDTLARLRKQDEERIRASAVLTKEVTRLQTELAQVRTQLGTMSESEKKRVETKVKALLEDYEIDQTLTQNRLGIESKTASLPSVDRTVSNQSFIYTNQNNDGSSGENTSYLMPQRYAGGLDQPQTNSRLPAVGGQYRSSAVDHRTAQLMTIIEDEAPIEDDFNFLLPSGSILTGVMLTGVDVPTSQEAFDNPLPALVRIKKEAILANHHRMDDVRECFALMGGYGNLSSERAYFRGQNITCILEDKTVIETPLDGYAVGEDGKAGLKGLLVTKNSKVLVNSMIAGFGSGLAKAFDVNPVPVIATDSDGTQQYQSVFSTSALQGGAAQGASNAMEKLADYYLKLADAMHPVIEVGAGRVIEFVVTKGSSPDAKK